MPTIEELLKANKPDEETQKARYAALKGKKCLILSNTLMMGDTIHDVADSTKWFCKWIQEQGCEVGWATPKGFEKDNLLKIYTDNGLYNKLIEVDDMASENAAQSIAEACKRENWIPDGVYSHIENMQPLIGATCEALGIPNNPHTAYQIARNKFLARKVLGDAGLATTKAVEVRNMDDCEKAIEIVGFPMVVKPTSGAGSQGVYRADTPEETRKLVSRVLEDVKSNVQLVYNPGVKDDQAPVFCETCMIAKEFEDYPVGEYDCDLLVWNGELVYGDVVDNWKPEPPYYMENGANFPTVIPEKARQELIDYAFKCVKAMGFKQGAFHVECMYTEKDGAILIEVNPRAGGGPSREFHLAVREQDPMINFFLSHMNIPINPPRVDAKIAAIGYDFCAPKTGRIESCDFLDEFKSHPWVNKVVYYKKPGDKVVGLDTAVPDWIAHLRIEAPPEKIQEAVRLCQKMAQEGLQKVNITKIADPPRRRSSMRQSLLDEVETIDPPQ